VRTAWRPDLPLVLPDGAILTAVGRDAVIVDGHTLKPTRTIKGGASDFWHVVMWNGFRPRAAGLDQPVEFQSEAPADTAPLDTGAVSDSTARPDSAPHPPDTTRAPRPIVPNLVPDLVPSLEAAVVSARGFIVQFDAAGTERQAKATLRSLKLPDGVPARVIPSTRKGKTVYRVVVGPFATRARAERIAEGAGHEYWVYEGAP
jgi:hypothetical protein